MLIVNESVLDLKSEYIYNSLIIYNILIIYNAITNTIYSIAFSIVSHGRSIGKRIIKKIQIKFQESLSEEKVKLLKNTGVIYLTPTQKIRMGGIYEKFQESQSTRSWLLLWTKL
jgi:hypothetical protein